jgi:hypothetical protein
VVFTAVGEGDLALATPLVVCVEAVVDHSLFGYCSALSLLFPICEKAFVEAAAFVENRPTPMDSFSTDEPLT